MLPLKKNLDDVKDTDETGEDDSERGSEGEDLPELIHADDGSDNEADSSDDGLDSGSSDDGSDNEADSSDDGLDSGSSDDGSDNEAENTESETGQRAQLLKQQASGSKAEARGAFSARPARGAVSVARLSAMPVAAHVVNPARLPAMRNGATFFLGDLSCFESRTVRGSPHAHLRVSDYLSKYVTKGDLHFPASKL
jgi:hypothetical protein